MRRFRAPVDPHLDPLRAPSARGQHPHTLKAADEVHNPQDMYEQRVQGANDYRRMPHDPRRARPVGQAPPAPPSLLDNPLVVFGLGALAVYALAKLTESGERPRSNPAPAPPPPQSVVVVSPPGIPVQTATATAAPLPALPSPAAGGDTLAQAAKALAEKTPEAKPKPKREVSEQRRKQMRELAKKQKRDPETGAFIPGKKRKKA